MMTLFIRSIRGRVFPFCFSDASSVDDVLENVELNEGIPRRQFRLINTAGKDIRQCGLSDQATYSTMLRVVGGGATCSKPTDAVQHLTLADLGLETLDELWRELEFVQSQIDEAVATNRPKYHIDSLLGQLELLNRVVLFEKRRRPSADPSATAVQENTAVSDQQPRSAPQIALQNNPLRHSHVKFSRSSLTSAPSGADLVSLGALQDITAVSNAAVDLHKELAELVSRHGDLSMEDIDQKLQDTRSFANQVDHLSVIADLRRMRALLEAIEDLANKQANALSQKMKVEKMQAMVEDLKFIPCDSVEHMILRCIICLELKNVPVPELADNELFRDANVDNLVDVQLRALLQKYMPENGTILSTLHTYYVANTSEEKIAFLRKLLRELYPVNIREVLRLFEKAKKAGRHLESKQVFLFVGATGTGKSTTIQFLSGGKMAKTNVKVDEQHSVTHISAIVAGGPESASVISSPLSTSETRYINPVQFPVSRVIPGYDPNVYVTLCDAPGFGDSTGPEVDIANGLGIIEAMKKCSNVKLVVLSSYKALGDRNEGIMKLARMVLAMVDGITQFDKSRLNDVHFLYTKYPEHSAVEGALASARSSIINQYGSEGAQSVPAVWVLDDMIEKANPKNGLLAVNPLCDNPGQLLRQLLGTGGGLSGDDLRFYICDESRIAMSNQAASDLKLLKVAIVTRELVVATYHLENLRQLASFTELCCADNKLELRSFLSKANEFIVNKLGELSNAFENQVLSLLTRSEAVGPSDKSALLQCFDFLTGLGELAVAVDFESLVVEINAVVEELAQLDLNDSRVRCYLRNLVDLQDDFKTVFNGRFSEDYKKLVTDGNARLVEKVHSLCNENDFVGTVPYVQIVFEAAAFLSQLSYAAKDEAADPRGKCMQEIISNAENYVQQVQEQYLLSLKKEDMKHLQAALMRLEDLANNRTLICFAANCGELLRNKLPAAANQRVPIDALDCRKPYESLVTGIATYFEGRLTFFVEQLERNFDVEKIESYISHMEILDHLQDVQKRVSLQCRGSSTAVEGIIRDKFKVLIKGVFENPRNAQMHRLNLAVSQVFAHKDKLDSICKGVLQKVVAEAESEIIGRYMAGYLQRAKQLRLSISNPGQVKDVLALLEDIEPWRSCFIDCIPSIAQYCEQVRCQLHRLLHGPLDDIVKSIGWESFIQYRTEKQRLEYLEEIAAHPAMSSPTKKFLQQHCQFDSIEQLEAYLQTQAKDDRQYVETIRSQKLSAELELKKLEKLFDECFAYFCDPDVAHFSPVAVNSIGAGNGQALPEHLRKLLQENAGRKNNFNSLPTRMVPQERASMLESSSPFVAPAVPKSSTGKLEVKRSQKKSERPQTAQSRAEFVAKVEEKALSNGFSSYTAVRQKRLSLQRTIVDKDNLLAEANRTNLALESLEEARRKYHVLLENEQNDFCCTEDQMTFLSNQEFVDPVNFFVELNELRNHHKTMASRPSQIGSFRLSYAALKGSGINQADMVVDLQFLNKALKFLTMVSDECEGDWPSSCRELQCRLKEYISAYGDFLDEEITGCWSRLQSSFPLAGDYSLRSFSKTIDAELTPIDSDPSTPSESSLEAPFLPFGAKAANALVDVQQLDERLRQFKKATANDVPLIGLAIEGKKRLRKYGAAFIECLQHFKKYAEESSSMRPIPASFGTFLQVLPELKGADQMFANMSGDDFAGILKDHKAEQVRSHKSLSALISKCQFSKALLELGDGSSILPSNQALLKLRSEWIRAADFLLKDLLQRVRKKQPLKEQWFLSEYRDIRHRLTEAQCAVNPVVRSYITTLTDLDMLDLLARVTEVQGLIESEIIAKLRKTTKECIDVLEFINAEEHLSSLTFMVEMFRNECTTTVPADVVAKLESRLLSTLNTESNGFVFESIIDISKPKVQKTLTKLQDAAQSGGLGKYKAHYQQALQLVVDKIGNAIESALKELQLKGVGQDSNRSLEVVSSRLPALRFAIASSSELQAKYGAEVNKVVAAMNLNW